MTVLFENLKSNIDAWAQTADIIFVTGPERSGTSMVYSSLVQLPHVRTPKKPTLETFVFVNTHLLCREKDPRIFPIKEYLGGHQRLMRLRFYLRKQFSEQYQMLATISDEQWQNTSTELWEKYELAHFVRAFFFFAWTLDPTKRLVEKTPAHLRFPERVYASFEQAKTVGIFRQPDEALASLRKRLKKELELGKDEGDSSLGWLKISVENYVNYVNFLEQKRLDWLKRKNGFFQLNYTEYTRNHDQIMTELLNYLGLKNSVGNNSGAGADSVDAPLWDPLLGKAVVENNIDIGRYLTEHELSYTRQHFADLPWPWQ